MYRSQVEQLLANIEGAHENYYASGVFSGPSLYFHQRALKDSLNGDVGKFAESSYAMLAAWGMHRMGKGGAKMTDFSTYEKSLQRAWSAICDLRSVSATSLRATDWIRLGEAFLEIKAMQSAFSLVANSKVLAHAVPNLVPPVDRQYTIRFLHGSKQLPKKIEDEWSLLRGFLENFFYPVVRDDRFTKVYEGWCEVESTFPWNTSALKTVDNILVGHMRGNV